MLFIVSLFGYISSTSPTHKNSFNRASFLEINPSECFYDLHYSNRSFFYCTVCFIRCTFESIQTDSDGSAISLNIQTPFTTNNYFEDCIFFNCTSKRGSAVYMNLEKECKTEIKKCTFTKCGCILFTIKDKCSANITDCIFRQNTATQNRGGSFYAYSNKISEFALKNCSFDFNTANEIGGAVFFYGIKASFESCKFTNNTAKLEGGSIISIYSICSFLFCLFDKNEATSKLDNPYLINYDEFTYGGAVTIRNDNATFDRCNFTNNKVYNHIKRFGGGGGAVSLFDAESFVIKCNFVNNQVDSYESYGGAVKFGCPYGIISECNFVNNTACLGKGNGDGGAIEVKASDYIYVNYIIKKQYNVTIKKCTFVDNKIKSENFNSGGGAVSFKHLFAIFFENSFVNNSVYTYRDSKGGAVYFDDAYGQIDCCNFTFNFVEINGSSLKNYEAPGSFGGAFYMFRSISFFTKCSFINNTGSGNGGAVYSSSGVNFTTCSFINNTVINYLSKQGLNIIICGGACYFTSKTVLVDNYFINNTATVNLCENSSQICVNAYGGAVYVEYSFVVLSNCSFMRNLVSVPNNHLNEFAGAIGLNSGKIENCTFTDNVAYNGCDIGYSQLSLSKGYYVYKVNSNVSMNNNFFMHHSLENHKINSIIFNY